MPRMTQYYVTESEVAKLFAQSGLPAEFQKLFARDYVSLKSDASETSDNVTEIIDDILVIDSRLDTQGAAITLQGSQIVLIIADLATLQTAFDGHVADSSAHNATGNILGTDDYATASTGGSVKLAAATAGAFLSTVLVTQTPTVAAAAYVQATAQTWVDAINEHKTAINQLKTDLNLLVTQFNASLSTERTALQRAT